MKRLWIASMMTILLSLSTGGILEAEEPPYLLVRIPVHSDIEAIPLLQMGLDIVDGQKQEYLEIVCHPADLAKIQALGYSVEVLIADMEAFYAENLGLTDDMGGYHTWSETADELFQVHLDHPDITTESFSIGQTIEGRETHAIKISDNPDIDEDEPEILFTSLHHAREPVSLELCLALVHQLTDSFGVNPILTEMVNTREIYFIPIVNPDGYVYNEMTNPHGGGMWRKNRRDNGGGSFGVDLNRNYGFEWGYDDIGSSPNPESETYRGTAPFSEPETENVRQFVNSRNFAVAMNIHTYGNEILYPWCSSHNGYTPEHSDFVAVASYMQEQWLDFCEQGTVWEVLYEENGGALDWMYGEQGEKPRMMTWDLEVGPNFWPPYWLALSLVETFSPPCLYLINQVENFTTPRLTLTPFSTPIQIPATGGSFDFNIQSSNSGPSAITCDYWCEVLLPDSTIYGPISGPVPLTLPGGNGINRDRTQMVPAPAPSGIYSYRWVAGEYPDVTWSVGSFEFEKLGQMDGGENGCWTKTGEGFELFPDIPAESIPVDANLTAVYPNPFNPVTTIGYTLPEQARVQMKVYNMLGREVVTLIDGWRDAGYHEVSFDAAGLVSGMYMYQLTAGEVNATGKMVLMK